MVEPVKVLYAGEVRDWPQDFAEVFLNTIAGDRKVKDKVNPPINLDRGIQKIIDDSSAKPALDFDEEEFYNEGLSALEKIKQDSIIDLLERADGDSTKYLKNSRWFEKVKDYSLGDILQDSTKKSDFMGYALNVPKGDSVVRQTAEFGKDIEDLPEERFPSMLRSKVVSNKAKIQKYVGEEDSVGNIIDVWDKVQLRSADNKKPRISFTIPNVTELKMRHLKETYPNVVYTKKNTQFTKDYKKQSTPLKGSITFTKREMNEMVADAQLLREEHKKFVRERKEAFKLKGKERIDALAEIDSKYPDMKSKYKTMWSDKEVKSFSTRKLENKLKNELEQHRKMITTNDYPLEDYAIRATFEFPEMVLSLDEGSEIKYSLYFQSITIGSFSLSPFMKDSKGKGKEKSKSVSDILSSLGITGRDRSAYNYWVSNVKDESEKPYEGEMGSEYEGTNTPKEYAEKKYQELHTDFPIEDMEELHDEIKELLPDAGGASFLLEGEGMSRGTEEDKDREYRHSQNMSILLDEIVEDFLDLQDHLE